MPQCFAYSVTTTIPLFSTQLLIFLSIIFNHATIVFCKKNNNNDNMLTHPLEVPPSILQDITNPLPSHDNTLFQQQITSNTYSEPFDFLNVAIWTRLSTVGKTGTHRANAIQSDQNELIRRLTSDVPTLSVFAQTFWVVNVLFARTTRMSLAVIENNEYVIRVGPIDDYNLEHGSVTTLGNPMDDAYATFDPVRIPGYDGSGVIIAVLDTGIDYTHESLGGRGTTNAYDRAYGVNPDDVENKHRRGLFPTQKIVEGYDFVGEVWGAPGDYDDHDYNQGYDFSLMSKNGKKTPQFDDDPIDYRGHGTSVADLIGGLGQGVAKGSELLAVKVCSAWEGVCSGIATVLGIEYAVKMKVDIINLSFGKPYGQPYDDLISLALQNAATDFNILSIAAAGNGKDRPYVIATPAAEPTVLAVAQTTNPTGYTPLTVNNIDYVMAFFEWSSTPSRHETIAGLFQYGNGRNGNLNGCDSFENRSLDGKIVMVDRGGCYFSTKVMNIEKARGSIAIIGNNVPGDPFSGSFTGGLDTPNIPAYMISQRDAQRLKTTTTGSSSTTASIDPSRVVYDKQNIVSSSSRGPDLSYNGPKPDIASPGEYLSATVGSGDETTTIVSGTGASTAIVSGYAALLKQSCRSRRTTSSSSLCTPLEIKARLMNNADRNVLYSDTTKNLAEVTRCGAGRLNIAKAMNATFWAYSVEDNQPSLSLGLVDGARPGYVTLRRTVRMTSLSDVSLTLTYDVEQGVVGKNNNDAVVVMVQRGDVVINPGDVFILGAGQTLDLDVTFVITVAKLPSNHMNSGLFGPNPFTLSANEITGYFILNDRSTTTTTTSVGLPWHILARVVADVTVDRNRLNVDALGTDIVLKNHGLGIATVELFNIVALNDENGKGGPGQNAPTPRIKAVGYRLIPVDKTECSDREAIQFAVSTWDRQRHLLPVTYEITLNQDPSDEDDFDQRTITISVNGSILTAVSDKDDDESTFYVSHATNTRNTIITACFGDVDPDVNSMVTFSALDTAFGGPGDTVSFRIEGEFNKQRYNTDREDDVSFNIDAQSEVSLAIFDRHEITDGYFAGSLVSNVLGVMLLTDSFRQYGVTGASTKESELLLILRSDVPVPFPKEKAPELPSWDERVYGLRGAEATMTTTTTTTTTKTKTKTKDKREKTTRHKEKRNNGPR